MSLSRLLPRGAAARLPASALLRLPSRGFSTLAERTRRVERWSWALPPLTEEEPMTTTRPRPSPSSRSTLPPAARTRLATLNANLVQMEYAVRGLLALRAQELERELRAGNSKLPFKDIIYCNIGNPQSVGQPPLTFVRQVLALCTAPFLLCHPAVGQLFPEDAIARARRILGSCPGVGAYSESKGLSVVRSSVAEFLARRDGHPADPEAVFLTAGASKAVMLVLNMLIRDARDGVLVPIPQYPLYSASVTRFGGTLLGYHLNEGAGWALDAEEIRKAISEAHSRGITVRCIAVINPGNPTGQVLSEANMREVLALCHEEGLVLLADEVYQANVYDPARPFVSFKKVLREMASPVELVSFHSVSKGIMGECGLRGGYMELVNFLPEVLEQVYKAVSVELCSNVPGQLAVELMVNPPKPGEPSHSQWKAEYDAVYGGLARRTARLAQGLSALPGVSCSPSPGAMYAFPRITLGPKVLQEAASLGLPADTYYCLRLLERTGVCVVPGSGFGQRPGTFHLRTTFLPSDEKIDEMVERIRAFHTAFAGVQ